GNMRATPQVDCREAACLSKHASRLQRAYDVLAPVYAGMFYLDKPARAFETTAVKPGIRLLAGSRNVINNLFEQCCYSLAVCCSSENRRILFHPSRAALLKMVEREAPCLPVSYLYRSFTSSAEPEKPKKEHDGYSLPGCYFPK